MAQRAMTAPVCRQGVSPVDGEVVPAAVQKPKKVSHERSIIKGIINRWRSGRFSFCLLVCAQSARTTHPWWHGGWGLQYVWMVGGLTKSRK